MMYGAGDDGAVTASTESSSHKSETLGSEDSEDEPKYEFESDVSESSSVLSGSNCATCDKLSVRWGFSQHAGSSDASIRSLPSPTPSGSSSDWLYMPHCRWCGCTAVFNGGDPWCARCLCWVPMDDDEEDDDED